MCQEMTRKVLALRLTCNNLHDFLLYSNVVYFVLTLSTVVDKTIRHLTLRKKGPQITS